ncbi:MAG: hypothetical protein EXQ63_00470 [Ilumatobacteraceae bacterium]|nr:hypothetical protein [Ilumatobacteraceae bacterium]
MSRRIEIELTSKRPDGTWTWRAAGAREPKGVVDSGIVPDGATVNETLRAEIETDLDGSRVLTMTSLKAKAARAGMLSLIPSDKKFEPVTSVLQKKSGHSDGPRSGPRRERSDGAPDRNRPPRTRTDAPAGDRTRSDKPRSDKPRSDKPRSDRPVSDRPRRPHFEVPEETPQRPKAKRIRAGRVNVDAVLTALPEAQRAVAERVLLGGLSAVRAGVAEQNAVALAAGRDVIPADGLVAIAEQLLPRLRVAEWLDRAQAAEKIMSEIDLRDLRALVVAGDNPAIARDQSTRTLAAAIKLSLARRQDEEIKNWLEDITLALKVGRVVRALNASSMPPKAGFPFPTELGNQLATAVSASLTADLLVDRWIIVLESAAFSPVHARIVPVALPTTVTEELTKTVTRLAPLMPQVAALFGVVVVAKKQMPRPLRPGRTTSKPVKTVEAPAKRVPVTAPEVIAETAPEVIAETAPEVIAETAPEVIAETAPEVIAETAPEVIAVTVEAQEPVVLESPDA